MPGPIGLAAILGAALVAVTGTAAGAAGTRAAPGPAAFVREVDNPWFPLRPGTVSVYRGVKDGEPTRDVVRVATGTRMIDGVRCIGVSDRLYSAGRLSERTTDWYSQDRDGTVWYFGEDTAELDRSGKVTSREGSWLAGVDGARAGIFMPARPMVGQAFRQEFLKGHAEDHFRVLSLHASAHVPAVTNERALLTKEWTPLEPGVVDHKLYVRGVGLVDERTIRGGNERNTLVRWTRWAGALRFVRNDPSVSPWIVYALLASLFAAPVAVLGKVGVQNVDPTLATAVRATVMMVFLVVVAIVSGKAGGVGDIDRRSFLFIPAVRPCRSRVVALLLRRAARRAGLRRRGARPWRWCSSSRSCSSARSSPRRARSARSSSSPGRSCSRSGGT